MEEDNAFSISTEEKITRKIKGYKTLTWFASRIVFPLMKKRTKKKKKYRYMYRCLYQQETGKSLSTKECGLIEERNRYCRSAGGPRRRRRWRRRKEGRKCVDYQICGINRMFLPFLLRFVCVCASAEKTENEWNERKGRDRSAEEKTKRKTQTKRQRRLTSNGFSERGKKQESKKQKAKSKKQKAKSKRQKDQAHQANAKHKRRATREKAQKVRN